MVLPARLLAVLPACLLAMQLCSLTSSLKQRCPHLRESHSGGATRTRRRCHPHASQRCLAGKRYSPLDRIDRASRPWDHPRDRWPNVSKVHVSIANLASDGGSKFGVLRRFPISVTAASFIAGRRSHDGILPRTCCPGATRQHL